MRVCVRICVCVCVCIRVCACVRWAGECVYKSCVWSVTPSLSPPGCIHRTFQYFGQWCLPLGQKWDNIAMQGYILSGAISVVIYSYCNEPRTPQCTELSARDEWSKAYVGLGGRDGMHLLQISQMQSQRTVGDFRKYGFQDCMNGSCWCAWWGGVTRSQCNAYTVSLDKDGALVMQIGTAASDARTMRIFGGKFVFQAMNLFRNPDINNSF